MRHQESGLKVAQWLAAHRLVSRVLHPAMEGSPDHDLWRRDFTGAGGLFAIELRPRGSKQAQRFLDALRLFALGFSWGGFESLALDADPQLVVREFPRSSKAR